MDEKVCKKLTASILTAILVTSIVMPAFAADIQNEPVTLSEEIIVSLTTEDFADCMSI